MATQPVHPLQDGTLNAAEEKRRENRTGELAGAVCINNMSKPVMILLGG